MDCCTSPPGPLWPSTPALFALTGLSFAYDPQAPQPGHFLLSDRSLARRPESQRRLQEWIGYLLTPRTHFQKMLMLVGPKRSGQRHGRPRHTSAARRPPRVRAALANLGEQFGLGILIEKSAAIIADARISGRTDTAVLTERLAVAFRRRHAEHPAEVPFPDWNGKLSTRFLLMTNELPRIEDASGRCVAVSRAGAHQESFYGCEERRRALRPVLPELPGILNWALEGSNGLYARGRFVQPASADALIQVFEGILAVRSARSFATSVNHDRLQVMQVSLYDAWKTWCAENSHDKRDRCKTLGRNLRAIAPWQDDPKRLRDDD